MIHLICFFLFIYLSKQDRTLDYLTLERPYTMFDYHWTSSGSVIRTDEKIHLTPNVKDLVGKIWTKQVFLFRE